MFVITFWYWGKFASTEPEKVYSHWLQPEPELGPRRGDEDGWYLPPANVVCEGYVFTGVCLSTGWVSIPGGGFSIPGGFSIWGGSPSRRGGSPSRGCSPPGGFSILGGSPSRGGSPSGGVGGSPSGQCAGGTHLLERILVYKTFHTAPDEGQGPEPWQRRIGCGPIFQVLKLFQVVCFNCISMDIGSPVLVLVQVSVKGFCIISVPVPVLFSVTASVITLLKWLFTNLTSQLYFWIVDQWINTMVSEHENLQGD